MIDKLDLRVPGDAQFTQSFGRLYADEARNPKRWKRSQYYSSSASFDDCGMDVLLHMECQTTPKRMHKLEVLRTGDKSYGEIADLCARVFDIDPMKLGVMRIDLTADVDGVSVDWFKRHTLVQQKQTRREIGTALPYMTIRKGQAETIYAGVKPNQIRIYDKVAERRMQYTRRHLAPYLRMTGDAITDMAFHKARGNDEEYAAAKAISEVEVPVFESIYGHANDAVITRVERQVAARDVEKIGLTTFGNLQIADTVDPFEKMIFFDEQGHEPRIEDWGFTDWNAGMNLRRRVEEFGLHETLRWMKANQGKNFDRAKKKWSPFLRLADNVVGIDAVRLKNLYQASTYRQLLRAA